MGSFLFGPTLDLDLLKKMYHGANVVFFKLQTGRRLSHDYRGDHLLGLFWIMDYFVDYLELFRVFVNFCGLFER